MEQKGGHQQLHEECIICTVVCQKAPLGCQAVSPYPQPLLSYTGLKASVDYLVIKNFIK